LGGRLFLGFFSLEVIVASCRRGFGEDAIAVEYFRLSCISYTHFYSMRLSMIKFDFFVGMKRVFLEILAVVFFPWLVSHRLEILL